MYRSWLTLYVLLVFISKEDENDEFYELTDKYYYKLLATKKEGKIDPHPCIWWINDSIV